MAAQAEPVKKKRLRLFALGQSFDMPFLILLIAVLIIGLICLFSASYVYAYYWYNNSYFFIKRQIIFALIGLAFMFAVSRSTITFCTNSRCR